MRGWIDIVEGKQPIIVYSLHPNEWGLPNQFVVKAEVEGKQIGYATFKKARNKYINKKNVYRVGYYTVFDGWRRKGVGQGMLDYFEGLGNIVIPSGAFGAGGTLTDDGFAHNKERLRHNPPSWLPDDWEVEFDKANRE